MLNSRLITSKEHIISSFVKYGRAFAMTWIDLSVVGQMEQPLNDVRAKLLVVATREVGASDAAAEKRVASEDPAFDFGIKADAAHGMAWRTDDLEGALSHFDDFTIFKIAVWLFTLTVEWQPEHLSLLVRTLKITFHIGMRRHLNVIAFLNGRIAKNMVDMAMGVDG